VSTSWESVPDRSVSRLRWFGALLVALLVAGVGTLGDYGLTWDEPYYFWAQEKQQRWFAQLVRAPDQALSREGLRLGWDPDPYHNPHPPFYKLLANLTRWLTPRSVDDFTAYRLTPATLYAVTGVLLGWLVARAKGVRVGVFAAALWATIPPVFAHAHFAATDTPMTFFGVATVAAFWRSRERRDGIVALGVLLGLAVATKFTAFLLPVPLVLWSARHRDRAGLLALTAAAPLALGIAILAVPYWWHDPVGGVVAFVRASTSRESHTPIAGLLWGKAYPFHAPWTQPFTMIAVGTPLTLWVPGLVGILRATVRRGRDPDSSMWVAAMSVPLVATLLPQAPNHDGLRLLMPLLPFVAALAAVELAEWGSLLGRFWLRASLGDSPRGAVALVITASAVVGVQASATWVYHPYQLSYYNELVAGLSGARSRGLEVTYWMEAFTPRVLRDVQALLPPSAEINLPVGDPFYFRYLQARGRLRPDLSFTSGAELPFQLVLSRVAVLGGERMSALDRVPALYSASFDDVPLVRLFRIAGPGASP
jgi:4-amino-4-deoxy-L-arabinose transferase-like glycosyltransferase